MLNLVSARPCTLTNGGITLAVQVKSSPEGQPQRLLDICPAAFKCGKLLPHSKPEIWARKPHATSSPWNLQKASRGPLTRGPTFEVLWIHRTKSVPFMNIAWPRLNSVTGIRFPRTQRVTLLFSRYVSLPVTPLPHRREIGGGGESRQFPLNSKPVLHVSFRGWPTVWWLALTTWPTQSHLGRVSVRDRLSRSGWSMDDCLS